MGVSREPHSHLSSSFGETAEHALSAVIIVFTWSPNVQVAATVWVVAIVQVLLGHPRVYLAPLYISALFAAAACVIDLEPWQGVMQPASGALMMASVLLKWILPVPTLPTPRGKCTVSRLVVHVRQAQLPSALAAAERKRAVMSGRKPVKSGKWGSDEDVPGDGNLNFMLHVYYPSSVKKPRLAPYLTHDTELIDAICRFVNMPKLMFHSMRYTKHFTFKGGDASRRMTSYPVIFFSHGLGGHPDIYRVLIEEMASQGFIVVAPEHNDQSGALAKLSNGLKTPMRLLSKREKEDDSICYPIRHSQLEHRVAELKVAMEFMKVACSSTAGAKGRSRYSPALEPLKGRLNMSRTAVAGHSFGAATALAFAQERKMLACIAYDAWMFPLSPSQRAKGLPDTPVLSINGRGFTVWPSNAYMLKHMLLPRVTTGAAMETDKVRKLRAEDTVPYPPSSSPANVVVAVRGLEHQSFSDFALFAPAWLLRRVKTVGSLDPRKGMALVGDFARQFLIKHVVMEGASSSKEKLQRVKAMGFLHTKKQPFATTATPLIDACAAQAGAGAELPKGVAKLVEVWGRGTAAE